jgi:uncharacterized Zn-finger protein
MVKDSPVYPKCFSNLEKHWKVCPYCGEKLFEKGMD